jgi:hypothetical protein
MNLKILFLIICTIIITGCNSELPSEKDIKNHFISEIVGFWEVSKFKLKALFI